MLQYQENISYLIPIVSNDHQLDQICKVNVQRQCEDRVSDSNTIGLFLRPRPNTNSSDHFSLKVRLYTEMKKPILNLKFHSWFINGHKTCQEVSWTTVITMKT